MRNHNHVPKDLGNPYHTDTRIIEIHLLQSTIYDNQHSLPDNANKNEEDLKGLRESIPVQIARSHERYMQVC